MFACVVGWKVKSEVGSELLYWQYQRCTPIWAMVFCTGNSVLNPVPIIGFFSSLSSSNSISYQRRVEQSPSS
jgi:hypothetical protein